MLNQETAVFTVPLHGEFSLRHVSFKPMVSFFSDSDNWNTGLQRPGSHQPQSKTEEEMLRKVLVAYRTHKLGCVLSLNLNIKLNDTYFPVLGYSSEFLRPFFS